MESPEPTQELARAKQIVFRLLKIRNRSEKEIKDRLKLKDLDDNTIEKTLQYFKDALLIDDRQFAKWWINARLTKPFGFRRIQFELKNKGIHDEIAKEELSAAFSQISEVRLMETLVRKRLSRYKNLDPLTKKRRLFEYLARRGFHIESINQTLQKI